MTALVAKHTPVPERHIYKAPGTLPLSALCLLPILIHTTTALYGSPPALILSRIPSPSCPAKEHAPFSLFPPLFYTHPAQMFSVQEPELIKDRER